MGSTSSREASRTSKQQPTPPNNKTCEVEAAGIASAEAAAALEGARAQLADIDRQSTQLRADHEARALELQRERDDLVDDEAAWSTKDAELVAHTGAPPRQLERLATLRARLLAEMPSLEQSARVTRFAAAKHEAQALRDALQQSATKLAAVRREANAMVAAASAANDAAAAEAEARFVEVRDLSAALSEEVPESARYPAKSVSLAMLSALDRRTAIESTGPLDDAALHRQVELMLVNFRFGMTVEYGLAQHGYSIAQQLEDLQAADGPHRYVARRMKMVRDQTDAAARNKREFERSTILTQLTKHAGRMGIDHGRPFTQDELRKVADDCHLTLRAEALGVLKPPAFALEAGE